MRTTRPDSRRAMLIGAAILIAVAHPLAARAQSPEPRIAPAVAPSPELPGDRLLTCRQIGNEIDAIMKRRGYDAAAAATKGDIASARRATCEVHRIAEERRLEDAAEWAESQKVPSLPAGIPPEAVEAYMVLSAPGAIAEEKKKEAARKARFEAQEARQAAMDAQVGTSWVGLYDAMNDPRIMRLALLLEEKQCGEGNEQTAIGGPTEQDPCADTLVPQAQVPAGLTFPPGVALPAGVKLPPGMLPPAGGAPGAAGSAARGVADPFGPAKPSAQGQQPTPPGTARSKPAGDPFKN